MLSWCGLVDKYDCTKGVWFAVRALDMVPLKVDRVLIYVYSGSLYGLFSYNMTKTTEHKYRDRIKIIYIILDKLNKNIKYNNWEIYRISTGEITHKILTLPPPKKNKQKNILARKQRTGVCYHLLVSHDTCSDKLLRASSVPVHVIWHDHGCNIQKLKHYQIYFFVYSPTLFLVCIHLTRWPCWWSIQQNLFSRDLHENGV